MHDYEAQIEATKAANDNFVASVDRGRAFVEGLSDKQRELELVLADVSAAYGINSEEFAKAQAQIKHEIEMLDPMFKQQMEAVQSMSRGMSDAFADMLMSNQDYLLSEKYIHHNYSLQNFSIHGVFFMKRYQLLLRP